MRVLFAKSIETHPENNMSTCINLRECYGDSYRVTGEPSCSHTHHNRLCDPWYAIVLCQNGHIYPFGGDMLAAATNNRGPIATRLAQLPCVRVHQDGDDGVTVVFPAGEFAQVAALLKPRRRRRLTPEQRAERIEQLAEARKLLPIGASKPLSQNAPDAQRRGASGAPGSQAVRAA
jgi:hypothetical protein